MKQFKATIELVGINPFVILPKDVLTYLFVQSQQEKSPIPVKGIVNNRYFVQNLIKFKGIWRLYINSEMLKNSPRRIGERINIKIDFDPTKRIVALHPKWVVALNQNKMAKDLFYSLRPSLQAEIVRYLSRLKNEETLNRNITRAIDFLLGKGRFIGRNSPV